MVDSKDIPDELIDALLANYEKPQDMLGQIALETLHVSKVKTRSLRRATAHINCAYAYAAGACFRSHQSNLKVKLL